MLYCSFQIHPGTIVPLGIWTNAEFRIGIIAGSLPPCRILYLRTLSRIRGDKPHDRENTWGVGSSRSSRSYFVRNISKFNKSFSRKRSNPASSSKSHRPSQRSSWNIKRTMDSKRDNGSDRSILPIYDQAALGSNLGSQRR